MRETEFSAQNNYKNKKYPTKKSDIFICIDNFLLSLIIKLKIEKALFLQISKVNIALALIINIVGRHGY